MKSWSLAAGVVAASPIVSAEAQAEKKCFVVNSYHAGYEWSDGIEKGIDEALAGKCKVEKFRMDTKNNPDPAFAKAKGEEAKKWIDAGNPDVVIIADDNAASHLLVPFYKDSKIPFVFCGLNWNVDKYGLPTKNTTGMIEVAPIQPMVQELKKSLKTFKTVAFVTMDNETERKDLDQYLKIFKGAGLEVKPYFATNFEDWKKQYVAAQAEDFVFVSNNAGIKGWDNDAAAAHAAQHGKKMSGSVYDWMAPYAAFVMAKSGYEQGEWAGKAAGQILGGKVPNTITMTTNKKYDPIVNPALYDKAPVKLSADFTEKAKPFRLPANK